MVYIETLNLSTIAWGQTREGQSRYKTHIKQEEGITTTIVWTSNYGTSSHQIISHSNIFTSLSYYSSHPSHTMNFLTSRLMS